MFKKMMLVTLLSMGVTLAKAAQCPLPTDWGRTEVGADKQWGLTKSDKITSENWQVAQTFFNYAEDTLPANMQVTVFVSRGGEVSCLYSVNEGGPLIAVTNKTVDFNQLPGAFKNSIFEGDVGMGPAAGISTEDKGAVLERSCQTTGDALGVCGWEWK